MDALVKFDDGFTYTVTVGTPESLIQLMKTKQT